MRKPLVYAIVALGVSTLACGQAAPATSPPSTAGAPTATPVTALTRSGGDKFVVAIEYAVPGLAEAYAPTGVRYAKPMPAYGVWGNIEPQPGRYDWAPLDAVIADYQAAGFTGIQLLLSAESPWAATRPPSGLDKGDSFPREEHLDDYSAFVRSVAERYDGDGVDDAPGLLFPIHHYGIEREYTGFWPSGDGQDYVRLLRIAYPQIHAADPDAEVLLVALLLTDVFDGAPEAEEVERRFRQTPILSYSLSDIQTLLAACDAYDIVDFHSLGDYSEIPPTVAWLRTALEANGCGERPIWIGDAFSMSALIGYADPFGLVPPRPFAPATLETRDAALTLLQSVADPAAVDHDEATAWLQAEMARGLVKKIVVAAGEGVAGINIGNLEDWSVGNAAVVNTGLVRSLGASAFMGMMDTSLTNRHAGGPRQGDLGTITRVRQPGPPRPAFYALQLVIDKIGGFTAVEKLDLGAGVWAYRFERSTGPMWVLWYDDGQLHLPGNTPPTTSIDLPTGTRRVLVTRTPTTAAGPETQILETDDTQLQITLDSTPIFAHASD
ncbi:MAG: hypothetical protein PVH62_03170 [Anaerolineae bacterium]|jgi:hypothetical protein